MSPTVTAANTYGATNNRLASQSGGSKTCSYDAAGNITGDGVFTCDNVGRLIAVSKGTAYFTIHHAIKV